MHAQVIARHALHPRLRGGRLLPPQVCRMATSAAFNCPAGWQGRTVATGNIKVRLKDLGYKRPSEILNRHLGVASRRLVRIFGCDTVLLQRLRVRYASHD